MAAAEIVTRVDGLRELEQNLIALANTYGPRNAISAVRAPLRASLRVVAEQIRINTPVDTGRLRESVRIRIGMATASLRRRPAIGANAILVGRVGWTWRTPSLWRQAIAVEFGTRTTPAVSPIRGALSTLANEAITNFAPALARSIEQTAARLERRSRAGRLRRR